LPAKDCVPLLRTSFEDYSAFERWLNEHRPDAVIGLLPSVHEWLIRAGARVPRDIGFASLIFNPKMPDQRTFSGFLSQDDAVAEAGVDALIAAIMANQTGLPQLQHELLVDPVWHEGSTLPDKSRSR
jgi:LacI family transcriptional regulator